MDLGNKKNSLDDQQVDATTLHTSFFFPSPLQASSGYLVQLEGAAIAAGIAQEEEKFMLLFSSDSGAVQHLKSSTRAEAITLMRELIGDYTEKFQAKDPTAFNLRPGVARLGRFLQADGVVLSLRDLFHFLCSGFEPAQYRLWYQATRDVTTDCDQFKVRSTFRGDIDLIKALIEDVGLDQHPQRGGIEAALYKWVQSWAKLPLLPKVSDDFSFLAYFCGALVELPDLEANDFRSLIVCLCDAAVERSDRAISDSRFDMFRAFARSSRRISFCQYLLKQHGRSLDLLGERLKAWLIINVLMSDAPDYLRLFRHSLRLDLFTEELELDHDELRSFIHSIVQKARPYRERYELDWLTEASELLALIIESNRKAAALALDRSPAVESLAVQLAGESHQSISSRDMKALLSHVTRLLQQSAIVGESAKESSEIFVEYFSPLNGTQSSNLAFRNSSRLCLALAETSAEEWDGGSERFREMAQLLSQLRWPTTSDDELSGKRMASLKTHELIFVAEANHALRRPSKLDAELDICDFLRSESAQGRLKRREIEDLLSQTNSNAYWLRHVPAQFAQVLERCLKHVSSSLLLIDDQEGQATVASESLESYRAQVIELCKYFYLFAGQSISRVDEEFQIWIAPKVRTLMGQLDEAQRSDWPVVQGNLVQGMPERVGPRLNSLMYRTTGIREEAHKQSNQSSLYSNFQLSVMGTSGAASEVSKVYADFVRGMAQKLSLGRSDRWLAELLANLVDLGDEERAWFATRKVLTEELRSKGYAVFSPEVDRVINKIADEFDGVEASYWIEFLAEGRAYLQFLTIGILMSERHQRIADEALTAMQSLNSLEKVTYPSAEDLGRMVKGFGQILLEQQPSLISFDQARFWLQEILPNHDQSKAFWRLLFIHLRNACAAGIPAEMVVTLGSWANRMASTVENLNGFKRTAREVFDPEKRAFAEGREDEFSWKNAFSGIMVVCIAEEAGRLPRAWMAQQWLESNAQIQQLSRPQWEQVSDAFEKKLQQEADPWFMPGFYSARKEIARKLDDQPLTGRGLTADEYAFVKRSQSGHAKTRWQNFASITRAEVGDAQSTFMTVAKLTAWPMMPEAEYRLKNQKRKQILGRTATFAPQSLKTGLLRRKPPTIPAKDQDSFHARSIGMVLGAMNGDLCCQLQCMFSLKMGPMNAWDFKNFQSFANEILGFEGGDENRDQVVARAWFAATLVQRSENLAEMVVKRWSPYGRQGAEKGLHARCQRDLNHLLTHLVYQVVGLTGLPPLDQWYQRHVLEFIGDKALEPFAELVDALRVVLKKELPLPAFEMAQEHLEPLEILLKEK